MSFLGAACHPRYLERWNWIYLAQVGETQLSDDEVKRTFVFDAQQDVLVFLHAQKTGGSTFGRHIVRNTVAGVPRPCVCGWRRKRCDCGDGHGRQWLFSRYSSGWVCGLHADWTELHDCVPRNLDKREGQKRQRRCACCIRVSHSVSTLKTQTDKETSG